MSTRPRQKLPPGPRSTWPGRHLFSFRRDAPNFLRRMAARYGDVSYFDAPRFSFYLISHPDYIRDVLVTNQHRFQKGEALRRAKFLFGEGLLTSEGDYHDRQRRLILPAFHRQRIARYCDLMAAWAARWRERWRDGEELDIALELKQMTLLIVCEALFGADVEREATEVANVVSDALTRFRPFAAPRPRAVLLLRKLLPASAQKPHTTARDSLNPIIYRIIAERRRDPRDRGDLLSMLLRAEVESGEGGEPMTDTQIRDEVTTLFLAGHETSANALTWTLHLLSRHPEIQARLHAEVDEALGGRLPTGEDLPRLTYASMVMTEAMRLYPTSWVMSRRAAEDYEVGGYSVPAGSTVVMSQYVTQHDPRFFPDPFRFDPERWTEEARRTRPEFSYFPFGGGKRRCIGEGFAWAEGVMILATLSQWWRVAPVSDNAVGMLPGMVLRPGPELRLRVGRR